MVLLLPGVVVEDEIIESAWQFLNDSLFSLRCLHCTALALAVGALRLAVDERDSAPDSMRFIMDVSYWEKTYGLKVSAIHETEHFLREVSKTLESQKAMD